MENQENEVLVKLIHQDVEEELSVIRQGKSLNSSVGGLIVTSAELALVAVTNTQKDEVLSFRMKNVALQALQYLEENCLNYINNKASEEYERLFRVALRLKQLSAK